MKFSALIGFFLLSFFVCGEVRAASLPDDRKLDPTVKEMIESLDAQFDLTDEQVEKVRPIFEYNLKKREEFYRREQQGANKKKLRKEVRAVRDEVEARLMQVLTPEQLQRGQS